MTQRSSGTRIHILKTAKHDVQKERVRDSEAVFDYAEKRVRFTETDPKDPNRPPRMIASEISEQTHDIISAIWAIRAMPLSVGAHYDLSVSDSGLIYPVPVKITGREVMKTVIGRVSCFRVEPEIFGKGRLIGEERGALIIWMTDDARHLPVRASIDSEFGKIEIRLKSATGGEYAGDNSPCNFRQKTAYLLFAVFALWKRKFTKKSRLREVSRLRRKKLS